MVAGGLLQRDAEGVNRVTSCIDPDHAVKVFALARDMLAAARSQILPGTTGEPSRCPARLCRSPPRPLAKHAPRCK